MKKKQRTDKPAPAGCAVNRRWRRGIWVVFGMALILSGLVYLSDVAMWPALSAPLTLHNPDAWLRLSQIRDWMAGDNFFSHNVPRTNAPAGDVVSHWTRPVDMIVAGLTHLAPGLFINFQLMFAAAVFPLALAAIAGVLLVAGAGRIFRHNHVIAATLLLFIASPYMPEYFRPGDVDHHGLMSVLWCGAVVLLLRETPSRWESLGAGLLSGIIIWISPEGLLPLAALICVSGLSAMYSKRHKDIETPFFVMMGAALAATAGLGFEVPLQEITTRLAYDTLSIVHVAFLWLCVAAAGFVLLLWQFAGTARGRGYIVFAAGLSAGLIMYGLYPRFFLGPFADADAYVTKTFLPMVQEAQPLFHNLGWGMFRTLAVPGLAMILACMALYPELVRDRRKFILRRLLGLMTFTFVLCLFQARWLYYLEPLAIMTAGGLLPAIAIRLRVFSLLPRRWQPYLILLAVSGTAAALSFAPRLTHSAKGGPDATCLQEMRYVIESQQLQKTAGLNSGVLYVMEDLAGETLFFTPYRIIAGNYHREASGLKDMQKIRDAADISTVRSIFRQRQVKFVLDCPVYHKENSALRRAEETPPDWLVPIEGLQFYSDGDKPVLLRVLP